MKYKLGNMLLIVTLALSLVALGKDSKPIQQATTLCAMAEGFVARQTGRECPYPVVDAEYRRAWFQGRGSEIR